MGCEDMQREVWGEVEMDEGEGERRVRVVDGGDG